MFSFEKKIDLAQIEKKIEKKIVGENPSLKIDNVGKSKKKLKKKSKKKFFEKKIRKKKSKKN